MGKNRTYEEGVKCWVKGLFGAILAIPDDRVEWNATNTELEVKGIKIDALLELKVKRKDRKPITRGQIQEALNHYFPVFLEILEDKRRVKKGRGSDVCHFTVKLWHKDKEENLKQFDIEWDKKRPPKSQAVAKKTNISTPLAPLGKGGLESVPLAPLSKGGSESVPNNIPPNAAKEFLGREKDLEEVHQLLQKNDRVAIAAAVGMGGVGKTELATQYARSQLQNYTGGVCWLSAQANVGTGIIRFAQLKFGIEAPQDWEFADKLQFCWEKWPPGNVLIVFDDVTDYKQQVKPYLPPPDSHRFKVLLTTRFKFGSELAQLQLDVLKPLAAMKVLKSLVGRQRLASEPLIARKLCKWLGYLPLGLELVGRYLEQQPNLSLEKMLARLKIKRLKHEAICDPDPLMRYELGVAAAFHLSWKKLNKKAKFVGCYLSLYALDTIPFSLEEIEDNEKQELWEIAIRDLLRLHLLQAVGKKTYRLHPLIRQFFQQKLDESGAADYMKRAFAAEMVAKAKQIPQHPTIGEINELVSAIPHIEEVANQDNHLIDYLSDDDLIWPFVGVGWFYEGQGFYQQAEPWKKQCVEVAKNRLGAEHPQVAVSLNNLAGLYSSQGRYDEAEQLYLQALEIDKQSLHADHPSIAIDLNNLAELYRSQGRYDEAEQLYLQAWEIDKKSLHADHPILATQLNNLALLYYYQGRYNEAETLYLQALEIDKKSLPADHPERAVHLNNLALLYSFQGRYNEAETLYLQALKIAKKSLPADHPSIAIDLNNLAGLYRSQGRYDEAEQLYLQALKIAKKSLPADHPHIAKHLKILAGLYESQGRYDEAESLYLQALENCQRVLGENHPTTVTLRQNYNNYNNFLDAYSNEYTVARIHLQDYLLK